MTTRKAFFWMHLATGCTAGAVIFLMSITGLLLMYERQILAWADRAPHRVEPPDGTPRLPVEELLEAVGDQKEPLSANFTLTLRADASEPAEINTGREGSLYVNPYNGRLLGRSGTGVRVFFQKLRAWHRWLGVEGAGMGRTRAKTVTGAANLAFLFVLLSGAYLWIPRQWSFRHVRPVLWFRRGLSGRSRDFNWHNVIGFWLLVPLFFVVLTAVPMSYGWANDLLYRIAGSEPPKPPSRDSDGRRRERPPLDSAGMNILWAYAEAQVPDWTSITAPVSAPPGKPVAFVIDRGDGGQPQKRATLTLDRSTGAVVRMETFADANAGRRLRMWSRFVHTGEAFGILGQTIAGLACAGGVMLVWTGVSLALRRLAAWKRRRRTGEPEPETVGAGAER